MLLVRLRAGPKHSLLDVFPQPDDRGSVVEQPPWPYGRTLIVTCCFDSNGTCRLLARLGAEKNIFHTPSKVERPVGRHIKSADDTRCHA